MLQKALAPGGGIHCECQGQSIVDVTVDVFTERRGGRVSSHGGGVESKLSDKLLATSWAKNPGHRTQGSIECN